MDIILQGIPHTICYIDDNILITGKNDDKHLANMEEELRCLSHHAIATKLSKCKFMLNSVEYLGHCIDSEGLHATQDKLF